MGRAIVTNGEFTTSVFDSTSTVDAAVSGGACSGTEALLYYMGVYVVQGEGEVLGDLFPIFIRANAFRSPTVKCFRFVCENFYVVNCVLYNVYFISCVFIVPYAFTVHCM